MSSAGEAATPFHALAIVASYNADAAPMLYELQSESTTIGSAEDNAIVLVDASIAPHHCTVRRQGESVYLLVDVGERLRARADTWDTALPGDTYWCPRHGKVEQLDARRWCAQCKRRRGSLWLMRPLHPGDTFEIGAAFRATYVVHEREGEARDASSPLSHPLAPAPARSISLIPAETSLPVRPPPRDDSNVWCWQPEGVPFPIYWHQRVNLHVTQHARQNMDREVGGVLLGEVGLDEQGQMYVYVTHAIKAEFTTEARGHLTFSHRTWLQIHSIHQTLYPDRLIVGWYHTHPGWTIFLSPWDLFIHRNFFKQPWQIALVIDPTLDRAGFFVWKDNQIASPHQPIAPFRLAELDYWMELFKPRVRVKLTDTTR
jgi:proteasome lid subunit RPN8/RPN11